MTRRVYQFGCLAPSEGAVHVRTQLRAAHEYRNDLVAIERGRRHALRLVDDTPEVRDAIEAVKVATKSMRVKMVQALRTARREARGDAPEELARIQSLDDEIRRAARAITPAFWGTYLDVEARHQQARSAPLYEDDAITPSDPKFVHGPRLGREMFDDPRAAWWLGDGQVGIQIQGGLTTTDALSGSDTRCRLVMRDGQYGTLWLRVGSDGREPIWAQWPIKVHRRVPDSATWKWVRVSVRRDGMRERWTAEITVDDSDASPRSLDADLTGTIAVEWEWSVVEGAGIRVARWADDRGQSGEVMLPKHIADGIRKPDGIRAVRDLVLNELRPKLARALRECREPLPRWLAEAGSALHLWKSPDRFRGLAARWRRERCNVARAAYEMLDTWEYGAEGHLYAYESGARGEALRERREFYRVLAARWARQYRTVLLSDQDLSREARWGEESDVRFTAAIHTLRDSLRNAFGEEDAIDSQWRDKPGEGDERAWCERTRDAWITGGARGDGRFAARKEKTANAWAKRRAVKAEKVRLSGAARETSVNGTE